jgi:hypothetical protein
MDLESWKSMYSEDEMYIVMDVAYKKLEQLNFENKILKQAFIEADKSIDCLANYGMDCDNCEPCRYLTSDIRLKAREIVDEN